MIVFIYDGSFEGFLTAIYYSYYKKITPTKIVKNYNDYTLFDKVVKINTNFFYAKKVHDALKKRFKTKHYKKIFHIFACDSIKFEKELYEFIVLGFKDQKNLSNINHPSIFFLEKLESEYFRYLHKMYGFLRFEELHDSTLYAKLEAKFDILAPLGKHFLKRVDGHNFIIHDIKRSLAFINLDQKQSIHHVKDFSLPKLSQNEKKFQDLWKLFFKQAAIKERKNLKLQQNFVPLVYRKYMIEFQSEI